MKLGEVLTLARIYSREVIERESLGDKRAEYHAQAAKVEAYRLLIESGLSPKEAVQRFAEIMKEVDL